MALFQYFAGFGPKDLMIFMYMPAIGLLLFASLIILIIKRRSHPYSLAILIFPLAAFGWYLYDKLTSRQVDKSQALVLAGIVAVVSIFVVTSTSLIPEEKSAVDTMAIVATMISIGFFIAAIIQRHK